MIYQPKVLAVPIAAGFLIGALVGCAGAPSPISLADEACHEAGFPAEHPRYFACLSVMAESYARQQERKGVTGAATTVELLGKYNWLKRPKPSIPQPGGPSGYKAVIGADGNVIGWVGE